MQPSPLPTPPQNLLQRVGETSGTDIEGAQGGDEATSGNRCADGTVNWNKTHVLHGEGPCFRPMHVLVGKLPPVIKKQWAGADGNSSPKHKECRKMVYTELDRPRAASNIPKFPKRKVPCCFSISAIPSYHQLIALFSETREAICVELCTP